MAISPSSPSLALVADICAVPGQQQRVCVGGRGMSSCGHYHQRLTNDRLWADVPAALESQDLPWAATNRLRGEFQA